MDSSRAESQATEEGTNSIIRDAPSTQNEDDEISVFFTTANEDDELVGASDVANGGASAKSLSTASNNFTKFVQWLWLTKQSDTGVVGNVARKLANKPYKDLDKTRIDYNVLDYYAGYLMRNTKTYQTASRYLSAIFCDTRTQLEKTGQVPPTFTTTKIRKGLIKFYAEKAAKDQSCLSKPHDELSRDDLIAIAVLCILFAEDDHELSVFVFLIISLVQFAGRVQESSLVRISNVVPCSVPEWATAEAYEKICGVKFWRMKTLTEPSPIQIFCHRDTFLLDWNFLCGYSLVCRRDSSGSGSVNPGIDCLFPGFFEKAERDAQASRDHTGKQNTGKTSEFWKRIFERIHQLGDGLEEGDIQRLMELGIAAVKPSKTVTSHGGKKHSVRLANEHPMVKTTWVCYRAGWRMQMVHTIFDYLNANPHNDRQVGRQLSGWSLIDGTGNIGGGRPPILQSVLMSTDDSDVPHKNLIARFSQCLFFKFESMWEGESEREELFQLLTASILRYLREFIDLVEVKFQGVEHLGGLPCHPFIEKIWVAAVGSGIPQDDIAATLLAWSKTISDDFVCRNICFAAESDVEALGEGFRVDPRALLATIREQHGTLQTLVRESHVLREEIRYVKKTLRAVDEKSDAMLNLLSSLQNPMYDDETTPIQTDNTNTATMVSPVRARVAALRFPTSLKGLKMPNTMIDFFLNGWYEVYQPDWCPETGMRAPKKDVKKTVRACLEFTSLFLTEHIPSLPDDAINSTSPEASDWRKHVTQASEIAWNKATTFLSENGLDHTASCSAFEKKFKTIDPDLWPEGPGEDGDNFGVLRSPEQLKHNVLQHRNRKRTRDVAQM